LNVFGRLIKICDYDAFTREYLAKKFGVTDYRPIDYTIPAKPKVAREPPPYNGFGDEEDSLGSCQRLDLKPPKKDGVRFAKFGNSGVKFVMKLDNGVATDDIRRFVLTCFLADDTICIFEPVQRNSGIVGGKFLQRQKVKKPDGTPFVAKDFFVGCRTVINGFPFIVTATDERSLSYMEHNPNDFPQSHVGRVTEKLRAYLSSSRSGLADALLRADQSHTGTVNFDELKGIVRSHNVGLTDHELLTLLRHFDRHGDAYISFGEFISRVMPEGSAIGRDPRDPEEIFAAYLDAQGAAMAANGVRDATIDTAAAAEGARMFLELYIARRQLFISEFRFIADYAKDSIIGEAEFKKCCRERLHLGIPDHQLNALAQCLFPEGAKRVPFEELMRLFNGTSNLSHNLEQIKSRSITPA
jgi:Ca2+-binding EF-hand superfamily protein